MKPERLADRHGALHRVHVLKMAVAISVDYIS